MHRETAPAVTDKHRLLFGAGFVFGVACALLVFAAVTASVAGDALGITDVIVTLAGGVLFTAIVGAGLYVLAFPENRLDLPVEEFVEKAVDVDVENDDVVTERL